LFNISEESGTADIGYVMGQAHQGRGYMREGVSSLIEHAFQTRGLRRLEANVDVRNIASHHLLLGLGFTREGMRREQKICKGELISLNVYGLLAREWQLRRQFS
jgi:ribosomal-protein-alanine N-acetyltransferase